MNYTDDANLLLLFFSSSFPIKYLLILPVHFLSLNLTMQSREVDSCWYSQFMYLGLELQDAVPTHSVPLPLVINFIATPPSQPQMYRKDTACRLHK